MAENRRFHVNTATGESGRCRAQAGGCPFAEEGFHFESQEEARSFYENFAEKLTDPRSSVDFHFITEQEKLDFTDGDCGLLARSLSERTGWPLVLLSKESLESLGDGGSDPEDSLEYLNWYHMAVRAPDGRIIDAVGAVTEDEFRSRWPGISELTEISGDKWERVQSWGANYKSDPESAAERILEVTDGLGLYGRSSQ